ncbi:MAG TPA: hypothetical protein VFE63_19205 [Roseiarcus sp.]|nr:hypothetical protein [Roseiarcus sp.]
MSLQNTEQAMLHRVSKGWLRLASRALSRLTRGAPSKQESPPAVSPPAYKPVVGLRKSAVCKDARGQLQTLELFLPADLVAQLARPLDIKFLDGDGPVTADELGKAVRANFAIARPVHEGGADPPTVTILWKKCVTTAPKTLAHIRSLCIG